MLDKVVFSEAWSAPLGQGDSGHRLALVGHVDQVEVSARARQEASSRDAFLPPVSVYRWWARRTEAVSGAIIRAAEREARSSGPLMIADPFAGGGVISFSAIKRGHTVYAQDINPWATHGLWTAMNLADSDALNTNGKALLARSRTLATQAYGSVFSSGEQCQIAHTIRVATSACSCCGHEHAMYPHALVSLCDRKEKQRDLGFVACRHGHISIASSQKKSRCAVCAEIVDPKASYLTRRQVTCPDCGHVESLEARAAGGSWNWSVALVDRSDGHNREISIATAAEIRQAEADHWRPKDGDDAIPDSSEARVLLRHGFTRWRDLYPRRQRHVISYLLREVQRLAIDEHIRPALRLAVLGTVEMAGYMSRWDRYYLKSFETMAAHRFNLTTLSVEPNVIGFQTHGRGSLARRLDSMTKAARWNAQNRTHALPALHSTTRQRSINWDGLHSHVVTGSSERLLLPSQSIDLVLTDPPYHDDVQYHDLSLPLRYWADLDRRRSSSDAVFGHLTKSLSSAYERIDLLKRIFAEISRVLKVDGRLVFSYANRAPEAWIGLFKALQSTSLKPIGYTIVHSENEKDHNKLARRACNLDLILELAPLQGQRSERHRPQSLFFTDEEHFLLTVGDFFLKLKELSDGWEETLLSALRSQAFLRPASVALKACKARL